MSNLETYGPTKPIPVLVEELNKLYHEHEAGEYEGTHPEIFEQLPPLWREMISVLNDQLGHGKVRVLDIGCGTGFEARQCLAAIRSERFERMACYDPSPGMLRLCRRSLAGGPNCIQFLTDLSELSEEGGKFNVLITNSVLHHMADPVSSILAVAPLLSPGAVWLCGHEPSRRFLRNPDCRAALQCYRAYDRWRKFLSPHRYARRLLRCVGATERPEDYAARRAVELSMFKRRPPARLVCELVDFHVVASESQMEQPKGLDFSELQSAFACEWKLVWRRTYSFLAQYYAGTLPAGWRNEERRLAAQHPDDGGNCCLVWRRCDARSEFADGSADIRLP